MGAAVPAAYTAHPMTARPAHRRTIERAVVGALLCAAAFAAQAQSAGARTGPEAVARLCLQSRLGQAEAQFQLAWIYAHAPEGQRRHDWASHLLHAAARQGHVAARRALDLAPWPEPALPDCLAAVGVKSAQAGVAASPAVPLVVVEAPPRIEYLVRLLAPRYRVSPRLALAIIDVESKFDPRAVSSKNAKGLMQLIPETAERFGVRDPFDARQNIQGGLAYLRWLLAYFEGNITLVAAAYNAGEGAVDKHLGVPPYAETRDYVQKVLARVGPGALPFDAKATEPSPHIATLRKLALARP
jgi:soluble lytic murein transglycosylase-like protein